LSAKHPADVEKFVARMGNRRLTRINLNTLITGRYSNDSIAYVTWKRTGIPFFWEGYIHTYLTDNGISRAQLTFGGAFGGAGIPVLGATDILVNENVRLPLVTPGNYHGYIPYGVPICSEYLAHPVLTKHKRESLGRRGFILRVPSLGIISANAINRQYEHMFQYRFICDQDMLLQIIADVRLLRM